MIELAQIELSRPVAPGWAVFPIAFLAIFVLAGHILSLWTADMPQSRRRIRMLSSSLMLLATPLIAWATAVLVPEQDKRLWVMAWTAITGVLFVVLLIALIDMVNNYRIAAKLRIEARRRLQEARRQAIEARIRGDRSVTAGESGR